MLERFKIFLSLLLLGIQAAWAGTGDKTIVVLADPHVMAPDLLVNEGKAWNNYLAGQRKLVD